MRFLTLIAGTLAFSFLAFMAVRLWGEGQHFKPFQSPYFTREITNDSPDIVLPWEQLQLLRDSGSTILWADVYRTLEENLLVKPWLDRNRPDKDLEQTASPARPLLKDLLKKFPKNRFVINCNSNVQNIHLQLAQVIQEAKATDRVLLQSNYNTILTSVKDVEPMMLFGSTPSDLTRIKTFHSLWLLSAAPFKGDVLFVSLKYRGRETIDRDIVIEMKRRFKKVFIGPLSTKEETQQAATLGADALFVEDPFLMVK